MLKNKIFELCVKLITLISFVILFSIILFILKEAYPLFSQTNIKDFLLGDRWRPVSARPSMGIFNIIMGTIYVGFVGVLLAFPIGIGTSIFLSCIIPQKLRDNLKPIINLLAAIPSVIYGFIGLVIVVKFFENLEMASGESVLAGGIVLSVMVLPFMIGISEETMSKLRKKYEGASINLGVSKYYMISELILPSSIKSIFVSLVLSLGRAFGETMAVMMVIGNAPIFPRLLGKAQTISSLIALEMGMVEIGSLHYNGLFASAVILMLMIFFINVGINYFSYKFIGDNL